MPADFKAPGRDVTFAWVFGTRPRPSNHPFRLLIDGQKRFEFRLSADASWKAAGVAGGQFRFDSVYEDAANSKYGYARVTIPDKWLTPGKPLRMRLEADMIDDTVFPRTYMHTDTVAALRAGPRDVFSRLVAGTQPDESLRLSVAARLAWAGKEVELQGGGKVLVRGQLAPADDKKISGATLSVPRSAGVTPEMAKDPFIILVDGKAVDRGSVSSHLLAAPDLIKRYRQVLDAVQRGQVKEDKLRDAAMVLARGELLVNLFGIGRGDIVQRAGTPEEACAALADALTAFDKPGDSFAARRQSMHSAYISRADGSGQIYVLYVPPDYDPAKKWPVVLGLHGAGGSFGGVGKSAKPSPFLRINVDGRGIRGSYEALSELDVLEALADVKKHYNIEPDRVAISGSSMGGMGTWKLACRYPDLFCAAAPDYGGAGGLHLENLANVPVWNFHDDVDWVVPIDCSREAVGRLRELGSPVIHTETSGGGHSSMRADPAWDRPGWLISQRRDPFPASVSYFTSTATRGRAYWLEILEFDDPNRVASFRAKAVGNQVFLDLDNVELLAVRLPAKLFDATAALTISIDHAPLRVEPPLPARVFVAPATQPSRGKFQIVRDDPRKPLPYRPYTAGGMNVMYTCGEPLLIVKGTGGGDAAMLKAIDKLCDRIATNCPPWNEMPLGRIPIKADVDITADDVAERNLIIVGPASANRYLARIIGKLPVAESGDAVKFGGETYSCARGGYGLFYYSPEAPKRYIVVMSGPNAERFEQVMWDHVADQMTEDNPFGLIVASARHVAWNKQWQPAAGAFDAERLPAAFAKWYTWRNLENAAIQRAVGADFVVRRYYGQTQPDEAAWDVTAARWHDLRTFSGGRQYVLLSDVSGEELLDIIKTISADPKKSLGIWPAVSPGQIQAGRRYVIAGDLIALSTPRKKNLPNVRRVYVNVFESMRRISRLPDEGRSGA